MARDRGLPPQEPTLSLKEEEEEEDVWETLWVCPVLLWVLTQWFLAGVTTEGQLHNNLISCPRHTVSLILRSPTYLGQMLLQCLLGISYFLGSLLEGEIHICSLGLDVLGALVENALNDAAQHGGCLALLFSVGNVCVSQRGPVLWGYGAEEKGGERGRRK